MSLFDLKYILRTALSWGKKIFLVMFVYVVIISLFAHFIAKDKAVNNITSINSFAQNRIKLYALVNNPELQKTKQGEQTLAIYRSIICGLIGETCTNNPTDAPKYMSQSFTGKISNLFVLPFTNPPASGVFWVKSGLEDAGFVPKSYAAEGMGFSSLRPIMNLWKVFRDLSYMLLVLVLIAIGFMIMFRMKLNPQTIISVENALPKIVVAMLLITFSFAIAGFMIDLMYVIIAVIIALISNNGAFYDIGKMQNNYLGGNPNALWDSLFMQGSNNHTDINVNIQNIIADPNASWQLGLNTAKDGVGNFISGFRLLNNLGYVLQKTITSALPSFISGTFYFILNGVVGVLLLEPLRTELGRIMTIPNGAGIGTFVAGNLPQLLFFSPWFILTGILGQFITALAIPLIIGALVFFTILFLFFRIFFMLFKAYLQVIFWVIIAPFMLLFEAVPGKSSFATWFKHLAADVFTFPIVIAILTLSFVLTKQIAAGQAVWQPPFLNALDPETLSTLIGMGVLLMTPDLVKVARESLFGVKDLPLNFGLGTFFAGAGAAGGGAMGLVGQIGSLNLGVSALVGDQNIFNKFKPRPNTNDSDIEGSAGGKKKMKTT